MVSLTVTNSRHLLDPQQPAQPLNTVSSTVKFLPIRNYLVSFCENIWTWNILWILLGKCTTIAPSLQWSSTTAIRRLIPAAVTNIVHNNLFNDSVPLGWGLQVYLEAKRWLFSPSVLCIKKYNLFHCSMCTIRRNDTRNTYIIDIKLLYNTLEVLLVVITTYI